MTPDPMVCAVVRARGPRAAVRETLDALAGQTRPVAGVLSAEASFHDVLGRARGEHPQADWYWLLDAGVTPAPDALGELLTAAAADGLPHPVLVAGKVVAQDGTVVDERAPWLPLLDREVVIAAARRRLVSLRLARWGSLLVRADAIDAHGLPRRDFDRGADDLEWTSRLLRDDHGYLAPRSLAEQRAGGGPDPGLEARDRARMVRGSGWVAQEPVWFAFMLGVDVLRELRARPRAAGRLVRGLATGGRRG